MPGDNRPVLLPAGAIQTSVTLNGSRSRATDLAAGATLTYAWGGTPKPTNEATPTVTLGEGKHTFTLVVTDSLGSSSVQDSVDITVRKPSAPVAGPGDDRPVLLPAGAIQTSVTLNGSRSRATDPAAGATLTYAWGGTPKPTNEATPTVTLGEGKHTFTLVVTDSLGSSSVQDSVDITVQKPGAPVADAGDDRPVLLPAGAIQTSVTLNGSRSRATDPAAGATLTYAWGGGTKTRQ